MKKYGLSRTHFRSNSPFSGMGGNVKLGYRMTSDSRKFSRMGCE